MANQKPRKAITDAPGYRARWPRNCTGCAQYKPIEGSDEGTCAKFEFETDGEYVCDAWEAVPPPTETPVPVVIVEPPTKTMSIPLPVVTQTVTELPMDKEIKLARAGEIKALGNGKVGGYGVRFGSPAERDLEGTYFAADTNFGPGDGDGQAVTMNHCIPLAPELKSLAEKLLPPVKTTRDELGIFASTVLDMADEYQRLVYELCQAGKFSWSSGTAQRMIRAEPDGKITNWPIVEWALTPIPAEPRLGAVRPTKSVDLEAPEALAEADGAGTPPTQSSAATPEPPIETVPAVDDTKSAAGQVEKPVEDQMANEVDIKAIAKQAADDAVAAVMAQLKSEPAHDSAGFAGKTGEDKGAIKAVNILRFGDVDENSDAVMREVYGGDYRQIMFDQMKAFGAYVRKGKTDPILTRQLWSVNDVKGLLKAGLEVSEIRATMVEGQDTLGGYAVPPQVSANIIARMAGLTAVRGGGALVVQTASKSLEFLQITGGTSRYTSGLRGAWGTEIQTPASKNFTFGLLQIPVNLDTYKVPMSVSLIEDASNVVSILEQQVADTLAIDEDDAFLIGDGANKPRGLLPGSTNADSLTTGNSGSGTTLTWAGLNTLRRAVASQYRANGRASLIGNSATGAIIESLVDGTSRPYVEELVPGVTKVKSATWRESEAMPDVAGSAYPLLYGDLSGYAIVERLGLAIQRYNDSYTGINVVEFHVRRRVGGHVIEPWKFAAQYVSA